MAQAPSIDDLRIDRVPDDEPSRAGRWILFIVLALLTILAAWWLLGRSRAVEVTTAPVREVRGGGAPAQGSVLDASGYVVARRQATVSSKVTGKIVAVLVEEGMEITEGQILARLDDAAVRRQLGLADAELEASRRAVRETEVLLDEARINLRRAVSLAESGVGSQADRDTTQARVDSLQARLEASQQQVQVSDRRRAVRRQDLDDMVIRAPFDGVAISKNAQPGEMISPVSAGGGFTRTGICTLVDMQSLEIEVDVNESYIGRVRSAQRVQAKLDAYPDWQIPGQVITTVPAADRQKATVRVRIAFDELDPRILPDMGAKVAFLEDAPETPPEGEARPVKLIPASAVTRDGDRDVVFVVTAEKAERRAVQTGRARGEDVEVTAGLSVGERVVVDIPEGLTDGDAVAVR